MEFQVVWPNPTRFFGLNPILGLNIRVESGRVGPQGKKTGPIGSGWPQIGFKFGFNLIMYLINPKNPILGLVGPQGPNSGWVGSGWAPRVQIRAELGRVGQVHLAALVWTVWCNWPAISLTLKEKKTHNFWSISKQKWSLWHLQTTSNNTLKKVFFEIGLLWNRTRLISNIQPTNSNIVGWHDSKYPYPNLVDRNNNRRKDNLPRREIPWRSSSHKEAHKKPKRRR